VLSQACISGAAGSKFSMRFRTASGVRSASESAGSAGGSERRRARLEAAEAPQITGLGHELS